MKKNDNRNNKTIGKKIITALQHNVFNGIPRCSVKMS